MTTWPNMSGLQSQYVVVWDSLSVAQCSLLWVPPSYDISCLYLYPFFCHQKSITMHKCTQVYTGYMGMRWSGCLWVQTSGLQSICFWIRVTVSDHLVWRWWGKSDLADPGYSPLTTFPPVSTNNPGHSGMRHLVKWMVKRRKQKCSATVIIQHTSLYRLNPEVQTVLTG